MKEATFKDRFWSKVATGDVDEHWLFVGGRSQGYGQVRFNGRSVKAHRVAWELTFGSIPIGMHVCHRCNVKLCCNPAHLYLASHEQNMQDALRDGLMPVGDRNGLRLHPERNPSLLYPERRPRGERHPCSKLTEQQVRDARKRRGTGETLTRIAKELGVSVALVSLVTLGKIWKHVE